MKRLLIVVDMQNDFISGSLANESAEKIVDTIVNELKHGNYDHVVFTRDTHLDDYLQTQEGKKLPIEHCILETHGWELDPRIKEVIPSLPNRTFFDKPTFGSVELVLHIKSLGDFDEIVLCGTCTDICVVSNALILKPSFRDAEISVLSYACAATTEEKQKEALSIMESCQINVIRKED